MEWVLAPGHSKGCRCDTCHEISRLSAELAAQKEATDAFWEQRDEWQERAQKAEAELCEAKARIAELEGAIEINKVGVKNLRARAERAEARIAELEGQNQHMYGVLLDAEDLLGVEETGELITKPIGRLRARAERAEAERDALREALKDMLARRRACRAGGVNETN